MAIMGGQYHEIRCDRADDFAGYRAVCSCGWRTPVTRNVFAVRLGISDHAIEVVRRFNAEAAKAQTALDAERSILE